MEIRQLGNSSINVTEQILGCWAIGGSYWGGTRDKDSIETIQTAIESGITTLDTAYIYGEGHSERIVGEAVKGYSREKLTIITKLWRTEMSKDKVEKACDNSLKYLNMEYVDVFFIHYPSDEGVPIEETMTEMMKLKEKGKIKSIGVSNFSQKELIEVRKYGEVDVIQPCYSLVWRFLDLNEMEYCKENSIGIISYSTLAQGILTGKFNKDTKFSSDDGRSRAPIFQPPYYEGALQVVEQMKPFAEKYHRTLSQIAINWVAYKDGITAPIVGARNKKQVLENLKATEFKMSDEDYNALDKISREYAYKLPKFKTFFQA